MGFTPVRVRVSPPAPSSLSAKTHLGHRFIGHITKTNLVENAELEAKQMRIFKHKHPILADKISLQRISHIVIDNK